MPVLLIRHASAGERNDWDGDDRLRPLDRKGRSQAKGLVKLLAGRPLTTIVSSPAVRCVETVRPLGKARKLEVDTDEDLWEEKPGPSLRLVLSLAGTDAAVCSHGDNIPSILQHLSVAEGLDLGSQPGWKKASVWVLESDGGRFTTATYLPPPR